MNIKKIIEIGLFFVTLQMHGASFQLYDHGDLKASSVVDPVNFSDYQNNDFELKKMPNTYDADGEVENKKTDSLKSNPNYESLEIVDNTIPKKYSVVPLTKSQQDQTSAKLRLSSISENTGFAVQRAAIQASNIVSSAFKPMDTWIQKNMLVKNSEVQNKFNQALNRLSELTTIPGEMMEPVRAVFTQAIDLVAAKSQKGDRFIKSAELASVINVVKSVLVTPVKVAIMTGGIAVGIGLGAAGGAVAGFGAGAYRTGKRFSEAKIIQRSGPVSDVITGTFVNAGDLLGKSLRDLILSPIARAGEGAYVGGKIAGTNIKNNVTGDVFKLLTKTADAKTIIDKEYGLSKDKDGKTFYDRLGVTDANKLNNLLIEKESIDFSSDMTPKESNKKFVKLEKISNKIDELEKKYSTDNFKKENTKSYGNLSSFSFTSSYLNNKYGSEYGSDFGSESDSLKSSIDEPSKLIIEPKSQSKSESLVTPEVKPDYVIANEAAALKRANAQERARQAKAIEKQAAQQAKVIEQLKAEQAKAKASTSKTVQRSESIKGF